MKKLSLIFLALLIVFCFSISVGAKSALFYFDTVTDINSKDEEFRTDYYKQVEASAKEELCGSKKPDNFPSEEKNEDANTFKTVTDIIRASNTSSL